ncbi:isopropanol dehydrogenase [Serendipita vermifera]|nr:isopropanol dehydrogenase [Serendipita vermifera]
MSLPSTHKALILSSFKDPLDMSVDHVPFPSLSPGSAVVRVLATNIAPRAKKTFTGQIPWSLKLPMAPGSASVCRVAAVGPDSVSLKVGQLVVVHTHIRGRDDPTLSILHGLMAAGPAAKLMEGEWRHGSYAEYLKAPLENIFPLDEEILVKNMGYKIPDLVYLPSLFVPMGGMTDIDLKAGESIIVAPATGWFSGAAVVMALSLGAIVVAVGRNEDKLKELTSKLGGLYGNRLSYVQLTGEVATDSAALRKASPGGKGFDAYIDLSPPQVTNSTHLKSSLMALKPRGRASLMGLIHGDVNIPYSFVMFNDIQIKGRLMYDREAVLRVIKMVECGLVKIGSALGIEIVGSFSLEDYEAALDAAEKSQGHGKLVVFTP